MRIPLIAALCAALCTSGCKPSAQSEEPPFPALAGKWQIVAARKGCDQTHLRFLNDKIVIYRDGVAMPGLDIKRAAANGAAYDLDVSPSRLAAAMANNDARAQELLNMEMRLTLVVRDNTMSVRDAQISDSKGLRAAAGIERRKMELMFALRKCPEAGNS